MENEFMTLGKSLKKLTDGKMLTSNEMAYRMMLGNMTTGIITVIGKKKIGKNMLMLNMAVNLARYNDVKELYITDGADTTEMAVRLALCATRGRYFECLDPDLSLEGKLESKISIVSKAEATADKIKDFISDSRGRRIILYMESPLYDDYKMLKDFITECHCIAFVRNEMEQSEFQLGLLNVAKHSDCIISLEARKIHGYRTNMLSMEILKDGMIKLMTFSMNVDYQKQMICSSISEMIEDPELPF